MGAAQFTRRKYAAYNAAKVDSAPALGYNLYTNGKLPVKGSAFPDVAQRGTGGCKVPASDWQPPWRWRRGVSRLIPLQICWS
ncbi:MAG TPA: hypothetical protein DG754_05510 [Bacteroidales bacterium]|nr:hypothetical protein [Bacteroidales bacterium]